MRYKKAKKEPHLIKNIRERLNDDDFRKSGSVQMEKSDYFVLEFCSHYTMAHIVLKKIAESLLDKDVGTAVAWYRYIGEHYTKGLGLIEAIDLLCVQMIDHGKEMIEVQLLRMTTEMNALLIELSHDSTSVENKNKLMVTVITMA